MTMPPEPERNLNPGIPAQGSPTTIGRAARGVVSAVASIGNWNVNTSGLSSLSSKIQQVKKDVDDLRASLGSLNTTARETGSNLSNVFSRSRPGSGGSGTTLSAGTVTGLTRNVPPQVGMDVRGAFDATPGGSKLSTGAFTRGAGIAALGELGARGVGALNTFMGNLQQGGMGLQFNAAQIGQMFGGGSTAGIQNQLLNIRNLGRGDLTQASSTLAQFPLLSAGRNLRSSARFISQLTTLNPSMGASGAAQIAATFASNPVMNALSMAGLPGGGLIGFGGRENSLQTVFNNLIRQFGGGNTVQSLRRMGQTNPGGLQTLVSNITARTGINNPQFAESLMAYIGSGGVVRSNDAVMNSLMTKQTAQAQFQQKGFQATAPSQIRMNQLAAGAYSQGGAAEQVLAPFLNIGNYAADVAGKLGHLGASAIELYGVFKMIRAILGVGGSSKGLLAGIPILGKLLGGSAARTGAGETATTIERTGPGVARSLASRAGEWASTTVRSLRGTAPDIGGSAAGRLVSRGAGAAGRILPSTLLGEVGKWGVSRVIGPVDPVQAVQAIYDMFTGGGPTAHMTPKQVARVVEHQHDMPVQTNTNTQLLATLIQLATMQHKSLRQVMQERHVTPRQLGMASWADVDSFWSQRQGTGDPAGGFSLSMGDPPTGSTTTAGLQPAMKSRVQAMMVANPNLKISSGHRTAKQQATLYALKGGRGVARPGRSMHQAGKAVDIGPPSQLGWVAKHAARFGLHRPAPGQEPWHLQMMGDAVSSIGGQLSLGRVDQGVDFGGAGNIASPASGTVIQVAGSTSGWGPSSGGVAPGGFIAIRLDQPPDPQHSVIYFAEGLTPLVQQGQHVNRGQVIAQANGNSIEAGWANPNAPMQPLNQITGGAYAGSGGTPEGQNFLNWLNGLPMSGGSGGTTGGGGSPQQQSTGTSGAATATAPTPGGIGNSFIARIKGLGWMSGGAPAAGGSATTATGARAVIPSGGGSTGGTGAGGGGGGGMGRLSAFLSAIKRHESGGNYQAGLGGTHNGGAYGMIDPYWGEVASQAGYSQYAAKSAGDAPPNIQDAVATYLATQYFNQFGDWKTVAEAWYVGPGLAGKPEEQNVVPPGGNTQTVGDMGNQIVQWMGDPNDWTGRSISAALSMYRPAGGGFQGGSSGLVGDPVMATFTPTGGPTGGPRLPGSRRRAANGNYYHFEINMHSVGVEYDAQRLADMAASKIEGRHQTRRLGEF